MNRILRVLVGNIGKNNVNLGSVSMREIGKEDAGVGIIIGQKDPLFDIIESDSGAVCNFLHGRSRVVQIRQHLLRKTASGVRMSNVHIDLPAFTLLLKGGDGETQLIAGA